LDLGSKFPSMKGIELYPKLAVGLQSQSDLFTVWSAEVAYGVLGLDGSLGYSSEKIQVPGEGYITLSAHAPSRITLTLKKPVMVSGYCSPTSMNPPELHFINFGKTTQSGEQTLARRLEPGTHTLSVETSSMVCAHSVWLLKIQTE